MSNAKPKVRAVVRPDRRLTAVLTVRLPLWATISRDPVRDHRQ